MTGKMLKEDTTKNPISLCPLLNNYLEKIGSFEIQTLQQNALNGDPEAQLELAYRYAFGIGVTTDNLEAVKWYFSLAMQEVTLSKYAQYALGKHYSTGHGVVENQGEAARFFRLAAEQGLSDAQFSLGQCYYLGNGVSRNPVEATKWYRAAAEQGLQIAQFHLGMRHVKGDGVPKNTVLGYMWINLSAIDGNRYASKSRDFLEKSMTLSQITEAQNMSCDWIVKFQETTF